VDDDRGPVPAGAPLLTSTRGLLIVFSTLTLLALIVLFGRPADTASYFAWTIEPPLTAAFLGAGYGAGCVLVALSLRSGNWLAVRVPLVTIAAFTSVTLLATLLHLDKFHLHGPLSIATIAGWFWLFIYVVIPPGMLLVWWRQDQRHRSALKHPVAAAAERIPRWLGGILAVQGGIMLVVGVILFVVPSTATTLWPWALTPLTGRAVAAWLIAFGLATGYAAARETLVNSQVQAISYAAFGGLELLALLRFPGEPDWSTVTAWSYLVVVLSIIAAGVAGVVMTYRRPVRSSAARPAV
jgi:hypothetical protein